MVSGTNLLTHLFYWLTVIFNNSVSFKYNSHCETNIFRPADSYKNLVTLVMMMEPTHSHWIIAKKQHWFDFNIPC